MESAILVRNLSVSYHGNQVLHRVGFTVPAGRLVGIIGPNGAGKTTLIKAMLGLVAVDSGAVAFFGGSPADQRQRTAYVPQRNVIDWDFPINVLETVLLGTYPHLGLFRKPGRTEREWAYECLRQVGMQDYAKRQIGALSGGQQQRMFIARTLAQRAMLFFLDEPFVGIDAGSEQMIIKILRGLRNEGKTVLVVNHDLSKVDDYFDDVLLINKELVGFGPVAEAFTQDALTTLFAAQLPLWQRVEVIA